MQKLDMQTPDITSMNIENIAKLFPNVITEKEDEKGDVIKAIDFDLLKQMLSKELVEDNNERYRLDWPGKKASILKANTPINKTLRPVKEDSVNFDTTENLYIEGDNFEVLKVLQESYLGKVKMIYIDPPYNTGKDFVYRDNFKVTKEEYEEGLEIVDEKGGKLIRNTDTNGRFHSDWLSMMYERLLVARDLLKDDGVIFMSIDDNEVHNLRKIVDEIFGEENFVGQFNWFKSATPPNLSLKIKKNIEYILCYTKTNNNIKFKGLQKESKSNDPLTKPQNTIKTLKFKPGTLIIDEFEGYYKMGIYGTDKYPNKLLNDLYIKNGTNSNEVIFENRFVWTQEKLEEELLKGTNIFLTKDSLVIAYKKNDYSEEVPPNLIDESFDVDTTEEAGRQLNRLFNGTKVFSFPKPISLLKYLIGFNFKKGDIILDFFSGSGSLAEAVMELNEHNLKFICVQVQEELNEKNCNSEAERQIIKNAIDFLNDIGKPLNICEIGKERIRRAGKKILEENKDKLSERETPLDIGFRVYKVDSSNMKDVFYHPTQITQSNLFDMANNIKEDRTSIDLLTQVMLDLGLTLDLPIESKTIAGNEVFFVAGNSLVACFDEYVDFSIVDEIAKLEPLKVVFRDSSFRTDSDRINFETRFKKLLNITDSNDKRIRVI